MGMSVNAFFYLSRLAQGSCGASRDFWQSRRFMKLLPKYTIDVGGGGGAKRTQSDV